MTILHIIGAAPGFEAGYEAEGYKVAINYWHPRADALLEIHAHSHPFSAKLAPHRANAEAVGCKLITCDTFDMHKAIELLESDYHSCSLTWAMAWAILETDATEIHIWGCDMSDVGDHYEKRAGVDYWMGYARALSIDVQIHGNSTICTTEDGLIYGLFTPMKRNFLTTVI